MAPKCVMERSTITELRNVTAKINVLLNNEYNVDKNLNNEEKTSLKAPNQVVNDLKKQKTVNFSQPNLDEIYRDRSRNYSRSSASSDVTIHDHLVDYINHDHNVNQGLEHIVGDDHNTSQDRDHIVRNNHVIDDDDVSHDSIVNESRDYFVKNDDIDNQGRDDIVNFKQSHNHIDDNMVSCQSLDRDFVQRLQEENERLRNLARQQEENIAVLSSEQARLQSQLWSARRPRTAPNALSLNTNTGQALNTSASASNLGWQKGGGEELNLFPYGQARILVPGDTLPFVGVLDGRYDHRRQLINQWRLLRRRLSPLDGASKTRTKSPHSREKTARDRPVSAGPVMCHHPASPAACCEQTSGHTACIIRETTDRRSKLETNKAREKSPGSVLREAKGNLRNMDSIKCCQPSKSREKSPNAVLREAKLRLRKLEIEAEAVQNSYLDFKKKRERVNFEPSEDTIVMNTTNLVPKHSREGYTSLKETPVTTINEIDKYLYNYLNECNIKVVNNVMEEPTKIHISPTYPDLQSDQLKLPKDNYLEKPLDEFRKLYNSEKYRKRSKVPKNVRNRRSKSLTENVDIFDDDVAVAEKKSILKNSPTKLSLAEDLSDDKCETSKVETLKKDDAEEKSMLESPAGDKNEETEYLEMSKNDPKNAQLDTLKTNIRKIFDIREDSDLKSSQRDDNIDSKETKKETNNLLRIQIENTTKNNLITVSNTKELKVEEDLLLYIENSVDTREIAKSNLESGIEQSPVVMTVVVSPKKNSEEIESLIKDNVPKDNESIERANNDVIEVILDEQEFHKNSAEFDALKSPSEDNASEFEKANDEYPDDFSADVDNYNSRSDYDQFTNITS